MGEWLYEYGLFLAEAATVVAAIGMVIGLLTKMRDKHRTSSAGKDSVGAVGAL